MGFSHTCSTDSLNGIFLHHDYTIEMVASIGIVGGTTFQGQGWVRSISLPWISSQVNCGHVFPMTSYNTLAFMS